MPRRHIVGEVVAVRPSHRFFVTEPDIVVRTDDGRELTGTAPALLHESTTVLLGRRVQFTATMPANATNFTHADHGTVVAPQFPARSGQLLRDRDAVEQTSTESPRSRGNLGEVLRMYRATS